MSESKPLSDPTRDLKTTATRAQEKRFMVSESKPLSDPTRGLKRPRPGLRRGGSWCQKANPYPTRLALGNGREQG